MSGTNRNVVPSVSSTSKYPPSSVENWSERFDPAVKVDVPDPEKENVTAATLTPNAACESRNDTLRSHRPAPNSIWAASRSVSASLTFGKLPGGNVQDFVSPDVAYRAAGRSITWTCGSSRLLFSRATELNAPLPLPPILPSEIWSSTPAPPTGDLCVAVTTTVSGGVT